MKLREKLNIYCNAEMRIVQRGKVTARTANTVMLLPTRSAKV